MRRENKDIYSEQLWDFLVNHNCSFYSPLSQDDTTDWISGNAMIKYDNNSVVWDANINMWKFQYTSSQPMGNSQFYARWDFNTPIASGTPWVISSLCEMYPYDIGHPDLPNLSRPCYDFYPTRMGLSFYALQNMINTCCQRFITENNITVQHQYYNGTDSIVYTYNQILSLSSSTGIRLGMPNNSSNKKRYGFRNFAVFIGTALTINEINEYFSLI